jgi:hypothetical protein
VRDGNQVGALQRQRLRSRRLAGAAAGDGERGAAEDQQRREATDRSGSAGAARCGLAPGRRRYA